MKKNRQIKQLGYVARKLLHVVLNMAVAVLAFYLSENMLFPIALAAFILIFTVEMIRLKTGARKLMNSTIEPVLKNREKKTFTGVFWISLAALAVSPFASPLTMSYAFAVLGLADPSAALVGRYTESSKIYRKKSIYGSLAFYLAALGVGLYYFAPLMASSPEKFPMLILVSVLLTLTEMFSEPFDDNFTLIVISVLLVNLLAL